jgi:GH25 family lysozyme M1 (1,4-beta-N-acetylmuramidase)
MSNRQALGIDINEWSRIGGIDYDLVIKHLQDGVYDFLIIKASYGEFKSLLFNEQKQDAEKLGIPYATYHFLVPAKNMRDQVRKYVEWVGTDQPVYILDVEKPNEKDSRAPNRRELLESIDEIIKLTNKKPVIYSRISIMEPIGFMEDAREFLLWIAQYPYDKSLLPAKEVQYKYFHEFARDYSWKLPPAVKDPALSEQVILWQFTEKGDGLHYIYSRTTKDPVFTRGMESADLNISIKGRDEFMQLMFGGKSVLSSSEEGNGASGVKVQSDEPTYAGITNQAMINLIFKAARSFTTDPWKDWIVRAGLEFLAIPDENRGKLYTGPRIESLPNLTEEEKGAILAAR